MDSLDYLRDEIRTYFPESRELHLSASFDNQRRFNFYFEIAPEQRFLLYLNWDGDIDRFTLKSLEFTDHGTLKELTDAYPEKGSKVFNIGQPYALVSFDYMGNDKLSVLNCKGVPPIDSQEISGRQLMYCVNPFQ